MNTLVNYPVPTTKKTYEVTFLFGVIGLMVIITLLYFLFYLGISRISNSQMEPTQKVPVQKSALV